MRKLTFFTKALCALFFLLGTGSLHAQLTGTKNIPGDYATLDLAITDLNLQGVGPGGVTLNLVAGNPQVAPAGGYAITATGTAANQVTIMGNGNVITAAAAPTVGSRNDAIFKIIGGDYITLQGFQMTENPANTTGGALAVQQMTEFGVALFAASATDGAQNNTIQANSITLSSSVSYQNAIGIFSTSSSSQTNGAQAATATSGTNSNNKFYANIISGVAYGMYFICEPITATIFETGNDVGGTAALTGNTITFGNNTTSDIGWTRFSGTTGAGIVFRNGAGNNVRFNTINSIPTLTFACAGVFVSAGTTPTGVTYTTTISNNAITLTNVGTAALTGVDFGYGITNGTIACSSNNITLNQTATAASSAAVIGIKANYTSATNTCSGNTVTINQSETTGTLSSATTGITVAATSTTINASTNSISINQNSSGTGTITGAIITLDLTGATTTTNALTNTILVNQTTAVATGIATAITGIKATTASSNLNITTNNVITIKQAVTGAGTYGGGALIFISMNAAHGNVTITGNTFNTTGSTIRGTGAMDCILGGSSTLTGLLTIKSNTANIDRVSTSGAMGFYTQTSTSPNDPADTISNNNITFTSLATSGSVTVINRVGGSTTAVRNICNNTISVSGASTGTVIGIVNGYSNPSRVSGNSVTISCSAPTVTGILAGGGGNPGNCTIQNNTVSLTSAAASPTAMTGISGATTGPFQITNNTISNMSFTSVNASSPTMSGIAVAVGTGNNISLNSISGITAGAAGSTGSPVVDGILISGGTSTNAFRNKIYSIVSNGSGTTGVVNGIRVSGGTTNAVYNNLIGTLTAPASANTDAIRGIGITSTTATSTLALYYNTVYINASSTGANFGTSGIFHTANATATTVALDMRNNLVINNSTAAGTGLVVAYRRSGVALNNYANTSGNNSFYAGTAGPANLIFNDGTSSDQTIAAYITRVSPRDGLSVSQNPAFSSLVGSNAGFLHIPAGTATAAESGGAVIATLTTDYDNDSRPGPVGSVNGGAINPDIGADEFDGIPLDVVPPVITYIPLSFTCSTADRTFTANITDVGGVPTSGILQPRVYFQKNVSGWNSTQGVLSSGTAQNGTWTFTISASAMGGIAIGDVITYYVIAQDLVTPTPNIISNPSAGFAASDVNTVTTPPTTPNSYTINNSLAGGTYTVGATGVYPTLTAAVAAYNANCIGGPIIFSLIDPAYSGSETFPITINQNPGASAINTLTIKPAATSTITGSVNNNALIRILGNYVTIDGSNSGGPSRDLTISNTSTTGPSVILIGSGGTIPVTNSGLKNSIVINGAQTSTAVVVSDGATLGNAGYFNNITITNNSIQKAFIGVYAIATVQAGNGSGLQVSNNSLNTSGANSIRRIGVYVQGVDGATVSSNTIGNFDNTSAENDNAVWLATGTVNTAVTNNTISTLGCTTTGNAPTAINITPSVPSANVTVTGNTISAMTSAGGAAGISTNGIFAGFATSGVTISNNQITNIKNTSTTGWGANGILLASTSTAAACTVTNNFISDVAGYGFNGALVDDNGNGIAVASGAGYNIYYNTVHLTSNQTAAGGQPAAFLVAVGVTANGAINLRNNIFNNAQTASTERYAINCAAPNTVFAAIDYNDYFTTGPNLGFIGSARNNLAAIQAGFGGNTNSVNILPVFTTATDLHLPVASNPTLQDLGVFISGVTTDIDGQTRNTCTPDMGADEFGTPREIDVQGNSVSIADGDVTPSATDFTDFGTQSVCNGTIVKTFTVNNTGTSDLTLGALTITGTNAADFTVTTPPVSPIAPGGSTTFTVTFDPSAAGARSATITLNSNDCDEAAFDYAILGTGTQVTASVGSQTNVTCSGGTNGSATVAVAGGIAPITYSWTSGGTAATESGLAAGSYTCTVTDVNGCTSAQIFTITEPLPITVSASASSSTICNGSNTTLTGSGATTYSWMPGSLSGTSVVVTPSATTTYTVTGTDGNGCIGTGNVTVTVNALPTVSASAGTSTICNGNSSSLTGSGASTYAWMPGSLSGTTVSVSPTATTTYTVTGTDANGCTGTDNVTVTVNALPTVAASAGSSAICNGNSTSLTGSGASTYAWMPGSLSGTTVTVSPTSTTTYTVTGTDANGCSNTGNVTVTVNALPTVSASAGTSTICNGNSSSLTGSGASTYAWMPGSLSGTTVSVSPTTTTTYTVTGTDANGCTGTSNVTVTVNALPTVSATAGTSPICAGSSSSLTGSGASTYAWMPGSLSGTTVSVSPATTTTYTVTGTDANGCSNTGNVTVTVNPLPTVAISASSTSICTGNTVTLTGSGASTYAWNPGSLTGTSVAVTPATTTTYTVTGTDANGCVNTDVVTITVGAQPVVTASAGSSSICNGSSTTLTAGGATTYTWMPGSLSGSTVTVSPTTTTTYTVTGVVSVGCQNTATTTVTVNTVPVVTLSGSNTFCAGGSTTLTGTSGGTSQWYLNGVAIPGATSPTYVATTAGVYNMIKTNLSGCFDSASTGITVTILALPTVTTSAPATICAGSSTTITASGANTYNWMPGSLSGSSQTVSPAATTSYTVTGTSVNGCTNTNTVTVTVSPTFTVSVASQTSVSCNSGSNGSATISASGGIGTLTYAWLPTGGNAATASGLAAGTYTCTITDNVGCTSTQSVTITQPTAIASSVSSQTNLLCNGISTGAATIAASGGTGTLTYAWAPSGGTAATATGLGAGGYTVTITDANTCTHTQTLTITQPSAITSSVSSQINVSCNSGSTGAATINAAGGTGSLAYAWTPSGGNAASATGLTAGNYTCTITDGNSCTHTQTVAITEPTAIASSVTSQTNVTCNGGNSGAATINASGGTGTLTYNWTPSGGTAASASGLGAGTYTCTITDANTCTHTQTLTITQPAAVTGTVTANTNATCGSSNGSATVTGSGGTGALSYSWAPSGGTAATATGLLAGVYTVTITDASSCTGTVVVTINNAGAATVTLAAQTNVTCNGGSNGAASVTATGGTGTLTYDWTPGNPAGDGTASVTGLTAGVWTCTVSDANGCITSQTVSITEPSAVTAFVSTQTNVSCNGGNNGSATVSASGGTGTLTYSWAPSGGTAATENSLAAGTYTCTITDASGCTGTQTATITEPSMIASSVSALTDASCFGIADGSATITATGGTGTLSYSWAPSGGTAASATGLGAGTYTVTITDVNSCVGTQTLTITEPVQVAVTANASATTVCSGSMVTLTGSGTATSYSWSGGVTDGVAFAATASGTYTVTGTDAGGCQNTDTITVNVNALPTVFANASAVNVCSGTMVTLTGTGTATSYSWSGGQTDGVAFAATTSASYTVTGTDANGCSDTASVFINVNALPVVALGPDQALCSGTVALDAQNAGSTYVWSDNSTSQTLTVSSTGIYWVDVTNSSGCTSRDSVDITINANPVVTLGNDSTLCGGSLVLDAGNAGASYLWSDSSTNQQLTVTSSGVYYVTATLTGGCTATDTINVTINPPVVVSLGNDSTQCGGSIVLDAGNAGSTYAWSDNSGNQTLTVTASGTYWVDVTNGSGCTSRDSVNITINTIPTVNFSITATTICIDDAPITLSATPAGGAFSGNGVTGSTFSPVAAGNGSQTITYTYTDVNGCSASANDAITVSPCTGIVENTFASASLYPNPNLGQFTLDLGYVPTSPVTIEITNSLGQLVQSFTMVSNVKHMELGADYESGVYMLRIINDGKSVSVLRVVKQ